MTSSTYPPDAIQSLRETLALHLSAPVPDVSAADFRRLPATTTPKQFMDRRDAALLLVMCDKCIGSVIGIDRIGRLR
jgi:hypothetical protein